MKKLAQQLKNKLEEIDLLNKIAKKDKNSEVFTRLRTDFISDYNILLAKYNKLQFEESKTELKFTNKELRLIKSTIENFFRYKWCPLEAEYPETKLIIKIKEALTDKY